MTEEAAWPTAEGPFSGNAVFEATELRLPLAAVWKRSITTDPNAGLRVGRNGLVVVPNGKTRLECLDLATGNERWALPTGRRSAVQCAVGGDHVLTEVADKASEYGVSVRLHALLDGREEGSFPVCLPALGTFTRGGPCVRLTNWVVRLDGPSCEPATSQQGKVLANHMVGVVEESGPTFFLASRDLISDQVRWRVPVEQGRYEDPLCLTEELVVTHVETPAGERWIRLRSSTDGALRWEVPAHDMRMSTWPMAVAGGRLYRWQLSDLLSQDVGKGEVRWTFRVAGPHSNLVVTRERLWFAAETRHGGFELIALDRRSGERVWATGINARPQGLGLALIGDSLLVSAGKTLTCWRHA